MASGKGKNFTRSKRRDRNHNKSPQRPRVKKREHAKDRGTAFEAPVTLDKTDYELLDSGAGEKLERFGTLVFARPCAHAIWPPAHPELWKQRHARFERNSSGRGTWKHQQNTPDAWILKAGPQAFVLKQTAFGHLGIFPEQHDQWAWIRETISTVKEKAILGPDEPLEVLNLFAYTGGSTLASASAKASVCHVDAAKGVVDWARENARHSGLEDAPIRWIVDDVKAFLTREARRERRYHGIILDPPSYGRGKKGETWKIEEDLPELLKLCRAVLADKPCFILLSCHSAGFTPYVLKRLVSKYLVPGESGHYSSGEMLLRSKADDADELHLPTGCYARWSCVE